jgi:2-oxo-hept-3-ene-1,7-dioate hydratase
MNIIDLLDLMATTGYVGNIERGPGRHGISNAFFLYIRDPDGHRIELYCSDYQTIDPDHEPIRWDLRDPQRQTLWGAPAPRSWFEEGTAFRRHSGSGAVLRGLPDHRGVRTALDQSAIEAAARRLDEAERTRRQIRAISVEHPEATIEDAYRIQEAWIAAKRELGRRVIGHKIGLTSKAMQAALGIGEPDSGYLLDDMLFADGGVVPGDRFIGLRVEAELAFVLKHDLSGPNCTVFDVLEATAYVTPALEILDTRIFRLDPDTKAPRNVVDTIADNAANAGIVLGGRPFRPEAHDMRWVGAICSKNGAVEETGLAAGRTEQSSERGRLAREPVPRRGAQPEVGRDRSCWVLHPADRGRVRRHDRRRLRPVRHRLLLLCLSAPDEACLVHGSRAAVLRHLDGSRSGRSRPPARGRVSGPSRADRRRRSPPCAGAGRDCRGRPCPFRDTARQASPELGQVLLRRRELPRPKRRVQGQLGRARSTRACSSASPRVSPGPDAPLIRPPESTQLDYEGEIVLVIGKRGAASRASAGRSTCWATRSQRGHDPRLGPTRQVQRHAGQELGRDRLDRPLDRDRG